MDFSRTAALQRDLRKIEHPHRATRHRYDQDLDMHLYTIAISRPRNSYTQRPHLGIFKPLKTAKDRQLREAAEKLSWQHEHYVPHWSENHVRVDCGAKEQTSNIDRLYSQ
jgi:hypothetical protein